MVFFGQWCHPFYLEMVTGHDEMQAIMEATCIAVGDRNCLLHLRGPQLLECLYNGCDEELYDERGYCIVSGESLVEFGARVRRLARSVRCTPMTMRGIHGRRACCAWRSVVWVLLMACVPFLRRRRICRNERNV
ncbi:translation initiation factor eIF-2B subunit epsilon [Trypanosoma cruzi]|nr:translation initiation factor eIF-2B subunit epsilon [Trypanosoma cruzi]